MSNVISLTGNLGQDSETRYMASGTAVLTFSVANSTGYGDHKKDTWYRVSLFGKQAESKLKDYLKKGQSVFVSGEFSANEYQAKDGTTKVSYEIRANIVELIGKRDNAEQRQQTEHQEQKRNGYAPNPDDFNGDIPW
jgi:single-strand DNA-binding protein